MAPKNRRKPISTAYALKSDDGVKNHRKSQYPAYALKSDDGQMKNTETRIKLFRNHSAIIR